MKVLVVGDGHSAIHEVAVADAFNKLGHNVKSFYWNSYFNLKNPIISLWQRVQNKFIFGPTINRLNADLLESTVRFNPKLVFIYRGTHVYSHTIEEIKKRLPSCVIYGYNNDDPFAEGHPPWLWRHFLKSVSRYDLMFAYRHHNLDDFLRIGARRVELLRSWFLPEQNYPVILTEDEKATYECDVVFVGHYENDGRLECLEEIVRRGWNLKIYGPGSQWDKKVSRSPFLFTHIPVQSVWGDDYNRALCGAKIALCFFSKLNRDTYTRRCFEIPSTGTMLLSEFSTDISMLFKESEEAEYFRNKDELIAKIDFYLKNDDKRLAIKGAGFKKAYQDGHDINSRMQMIISLIDKDYNK